MSTETSQTVTARPLENRVALVTGSSRGIGAATATRLAQLGAKIVVNYRDKAPRAEKVVQSIVESGGEAIALRADVTKADEVEAMIGAIREKWGKLDLLVLNASGGMEKNAAADYALTLNRDAQVGLLESAIPLMPRGSHVVFVTSHQAHFIRTTETLPEYRPVAESKRAGEDALRERIPELDEKGIEFVVVSGDMIVGTVTATLLNRINPGVLDARKEEVGRLYSVDEFAAEVVAAATEPVPANHTRYVGDVSGFVPA